MTTKDERNLSFEEIVELRRRKRMAKHDNEFNTTTFGPLKHAPWDNTNKVLDRVRSEIDELRRKEAAPWDNIDPDPVWHKPDDAVVLAEPDCVYCEAWAAEEQFHMAVGNVNSNAKGSGARANGDKVPMDLIPVSVWRNKWRTAMSQNVDGEALMDVMFALQRWQEGEDEPLSSVLSSHCLDGACRVFEYGAKKYAAWNWAKGMAWSVPLGCALRHMQAVLDGELLDDESGLPHIDHVFSNLIMLDYFETIYPEGDDRPIFEEYNK